MIIIIICAFLYVIVYNVNLNKAKKLFIQEEYYEAKKSIENLYPKSEEMKKIEVYGQLMTSYNLAVLNYKIATDYLELADDEKATECFKKAIQDSVLGLKQIEKYLNEEHSEMEYKYAKLIKEDYYEFLDNYLKLDETEVNNFLKLNYDKITEEANNHAIVLTTFNNILKEY